MGFVKALIDADIVTFRAAFSAEPPSLITLLQQGVPELEALDAVKKAEDNGEWIANARADEIIDQILHDVEADTFELWLTGADNFRYKVFPDYKANRKGIPRPKWEHTVKSHLRSKWFANLSDGCEADDMLGVRSVQMGATSVICTIDKDLDQIPGKHYNFVKKEKYDVSTDEGNRFFFYQLLCGDPTDGIKGVPGIGPKKANRLLDSVPPVEWLEEISKLYASYEELDLNAQCVYIWRKEQDNWRNLIESLSLGGQTQESSPS